MIETAELLVGVGFVGVAFVGSYYAYSTYGAFRHDVMEKVFGFLTAAFLLVGGVATLLVMGGLAGMSDGYYEFITVASLVSFALILLGLISVLTWAKGTKELRSAL